MHKLALGVAVGTVAGCAVAALTLFHVVLRPEVALPIELLAQFFFGYEVSWWGAAVGFCWGFFTGFVAGWFAAFVRNAVSALSLVIFRTKGELAHMRDFLDRI